MRVKQWKLMKKAYYSYIQQMIWTIGLIGWLSVYLPFKGEWLFAGLTFILVESFIIIVEQYKKMPMTYAVLVVLAAASLYLVARSGQRAEDYIRTAYEWVITYDGSEAAYDALSAKVCWLGLVLGGSLVSCLGNKLKLMRRGWMLGCIVILIILGLKESNMPRIGNVCLVTYILMELTGIQHERQYGKESTETWKVVYTLIPFMILLISLCSLLPQNENPISWAWVDKMYQNIRTGMQDVGAEISFVVGSKTDEFGLCLWGVEKEKKLNSHLNQSQEIMLKAQSNVLPHQNVYLAGSYKEVYLGDGWKSEASDPEGLLSDSDLDTYELLYGLRGESVVSEEEKLLSERKIKIAYEGIRTKNAFVPEKLESLVKTDIKNEPKARVDGVFFPKRQKRGSEYLITFLEMNTESDWFKERIRSLDKSSKAEGKVMDQEAFLNQYREIVDTKWLRSVLEQPQLNERLMKRRACIYKNYTALPKTLPGRVKKLTLEVTKDAKTRYDQLKCIEAYLKNYTYTTTPVRNIAGHDFVDDFLFEGKEGYCTYFASAMAVMARTIGEVFFVLRQMGYEIETGETLLQYKERLQIRFKQEKEVLQEIFELYSGWRYGLEEEAEEKRVRMAQLCQQFIKVQNENNGKIKPLWWQIRFRIYDYRRV